MRNKIKFLASGTGSSKDINTIYAILNTLDSKATGLMEVNAFLAAFVLVFIAYHNASAGKIAHDPFVVAMLTLLALLLSTIACFFIVQIRWGFLGKLTCDAHGTVLNNSDETELDSLIQSITHRTRLYWLAWWMTLACLLAMLYLVWVLWRPTCSASGRG